MTLTDRISKVLDAKGVPHTTPRVRSMFSVYFREEPVHNFEDAKATVGEFFKKLFHGLLDRGVLLAPSPFEAGFVSLAHDAAAIDQTIEAFEGADAAI